MSSDLELLLSWLLEMKVINKKEKEEFSQKNELFAKAICTGLILPKVALKMDKVSQKGNRYPCIGPIVMKYYIRRY